MFGESAGPEVQRSGREAFLIDAHYVICDCLSQELKRRKDAYKNVDLVSSLKHNQWTLNKSVQPQKN